MTIKVILPVALACALFPAASRADTPELVDPSRPVMRLGTDRALLQWFTREPCETRVQIREGGLPAKTLLPDGKTASPWIGPTVRVVEGSSAKSAYHRLEVRGLKPGRRYFYRVFDPAAVPTGLEQSWGAQAPWRREYSFSTLAPRGRKTIIRLPIKVLLMPNVLNVASARQNSSIAPPPPAMSTDDLDRIRREYADSSRFLFINNHMRVWIDYHIAVDDRWQRWGEEPSGVDTVYRGWPACRSWAGKDFEGPGGGALTFVDFDNPRRVSTQLIYDQNRFIGQIEQAFVRRWNAAKKQWEFYNSGGGTFGIDEWPKGIPGRSQYLGGGDTAWLATHEFHHQLESIGAFSLANREDDRVIFDHFFPRRRVKKEDGTWDEWTWNTSWKHGEHWDGIAYFDRLLTPLQWLRIHFGETLTVVDADDDGIPDDDPRLPFDEKRFGSDPRKAMTDGRMNDLAKAQTATWAPSPLTSSWQKGRPDTRYRPNPASPDTDADGLEDAVDPYPLYPWQPFIWPMTAHVDGKADEWDAVPPSGEVDREGMTIQLKQAHDDAAYYAMIRLSGAWSRVSVALDGEAQGYYTTSSTYAFEITPAAQGASVRAVSGNGCPGLVWKAEKDASATVVEVSIPNRGESLWFWSGGGREIGASLSAATTEGRPVSLYQPYHFFYATMLERAGKARLPTGAPPELTEAAAQKRFDFTAGPPPEWKFDPRAWKHAQGAMRFSDVEGAEQALYLECPETTAFDLWVEFEAKNDMHLGGWTGPKMDNVTDYVAFLGGFGNARSMIRLFGQEAAVEDSGITPGRRSMQLTRRNGEVWLLYDGKPVAFARDPSPARRITRLGILGGWGGAQAVYRVRLRKE